VSAVVSILHRASGALLFLLLPLVLYALDRSLSSEAGFEAVRADGRLRLVLAVWLGCYAYHLLAGIRFLVFDLHGKGLYRHVRSSAWAVLLAALLAIVLIVFGLSGCAA
jgi:succinate dehydrogenase / fumarate reductase cytochrome b subunit